MASRIAKRTSEIFLMGVLCLGGFFGMKSCYSQSPLNNRGEVLVLRAEKLEEKADEKPFEYSVIKDFFIRDFLRGYLDDVTPKSDNFQKLERKYRKEGLLEQYVSAHALCLDLAYSNRGREIDEKSYANLGKRLAEKQQETSKGISPVNNLDKTVLRNYEKWGKEKTDFFSRLFNASKEIKKQEDASDEEYALKVIRAAYIKEEYEKYVKNLNNICDGLYDSMRKTLGFMAFFTKREFKTIAECTRKAYTESINKYFSGEGK